MPITPSLVIFYLEWAGVRLLSLPSQRVKPQRIRAFWPAEYSQDRFQVLEFRTMGLAKIPSPPPHEVSLMDEILVLPNLCGDIVTRRILHARLLVIPLNGRYLYPWPRIADRLGVSVWIAKRRHRNGIDEICEKIPNNTVEKLNAGISGSFSIPSTNPFPRRLTPLPVIARS